MTDIQQWRRMIQPTRARTPAVDFEDSDLSTISTSKATLSSPTAPRIGLKPKFSAYFTQQPATPSRADVDGLFSPQFPSWPPDEPLPNPDAESLVDSVMCRLLASPNDSLDLRFNGVLLQIFESFRSIHDERNQLALELQEWKERLYALESAVQRSAEQWQREKLDYKAEVKRLELILAKGKRGLAEVTLARQDSVLRGRHRTNISEMDDSLETILKFLEKTKRYEDKVWSSQRATMRTRSPSAKMRRLSRTLAASHHVDLPLAALEEVSDGTSSTFSCAGDLLPDEASDINLIEVAGTDNDFVATKRIAQVLAKRHHVDPDTIMPKLHDLFGLGIHQAPEQPVPAVSGALRKNSTLRSKASGFFSKLRPQLNVDTSIASGRRFSLEAGDDANASLSAPGLDNLPPAVKDRLLRKSVSVSCLSEPVGFPAAASGPEPALSPVAQSPTPSALPSEWTEAAPGSAEMKRPSRIPTPVHGSGRPRRDREDSASSLLTAIKHAGGLSQRSGSMSGSAYSSPSTSRVDLTQGLQGAETTQASSYRSNRLLEHTNALRSTTLAIAAAKAASSMSSHADHDKAASQRERQSMERSNNSRTSTTQYVLDPQVGELQKENNRPMGWTSNA